ncbi:hypothetical protein [Streptomyces sp. NPDC085540]|uniref:hypothetical protein n=1 Tax=Streptomyces sp. NPDC085540 TaxID=3365730 RepID=UPI0037D45071
MTGHGRASLAPEPGGAGVELLAELAGVLGARPVVVVPRPGLVLVGPHLGRVLPDLVVDGVDPALRLLVLQVDALVGLALVLQVDALVGASRRSPSLRS